MQTLPLMFKKVIRPLFGRQISRFSPVKSAFNLLLWLFKTLNITGKVNDQKISLGSKVGLELFVGAIQKPFEIRVFKQQIKRGDVVLDLGANIGYYTLIAAKLVGENGKVFAFEPEKDNFSMLEKNIDLNHCKNIIPIRKAVSNETKKSRLYLNRNDPSMHTLWEKDSSLESIEIKTTKLDDFFKNYEGKIDLIKMDIEGAEGWALQGMTSILSKNQNLKIITEFNPLLLKNSGIEPEEYLKSLVKFGFKLYYINEREKKLVPVTVQEIIYEHPEKEYTNLLCVR